MTKDGWDDFDDYLSGDALRITRCGLGQSALRGRRLNFLPREGRAGGEVRRTGIFVETAA